RTRHPGQGRSLPPVPGELLRPAARLRTLPASEQRAPARGDGLARLQRSGARRRAPAGVAGIRLPRRVPAQHRRPAAGEVPAPLQRDRRAPCIGRLAPRDLRPVPGRGRHRRPGRRSARARPGAARPVGGAPAAGELCRPGPPGSADAHDHLRARDLRQRARRPGAGVAGLPGGPRDAAQVAVTTFRRLPMELRPILSTLRRHKTAAALIVLEIALSCAIICNALFMIGGRLQRMDRPTGMAENEIVRVQPAGIGTDENEAALTASDLALLRALPGVKAAATTNQVIYGGSSWNTGVSVTPDQTTPNFNAAMYIGSAELPETLGLKLVKGRFFRPDEMIEWEVANAPGARTQIPSVVITQAMADKLWPGEEPLGKRIYSGDENGTQVV